MNKTKIPLIAIAIFSIIILFANGNVEKVFAETIIYQVVGGTRKAVYSGEKMVGEEITSTSSLNSLSFDKIQIPIKKTGNPTGSFYIGIWNSTIEPHNNNAKLLIATVSVSSLTTSYQTFTYQFSPAWTLTSNEVIGVFYNNTGASDTVDLGSLAGDRFNGASTLQTGWTSAWSDTATRDIDMTLTDTEGDAGSSLSACIDTDLNGTLDLCFQDTDGDGIPDNGIGGSLGAFQSNANVTQMGQTWFCAFNIGDACTNDNAETNGVGVFYLLIIILFSYAIVVSIHLMAIKASNNNVGGTQALMIHPILLLVMLFVDVGLSWYLNFIPDTIFYSILVLMVGLGGFGIYRMVTKDN